MLLASSKPVGNQILNVPNLLTTARFVLAIVVFALIPLEQYAAAVIVFVIAASTDWVDGWWARKYGQVTKLGRIFDPFVDKIIICGVFTFLAAERGSGILPWMAVLVLGREILVTAIRGFIEQQGGDFSAQFAGKLKMVFQCVAVVASLIALRHYAQGDVADSSRPWLKEPLPQWLFWTLHGSVWLAVGSTVWSGLEYIVAAARILGKPGR
jgi:CDP-diacylglycerol---glycerol-3-phosphate 3-phosphatidyltransferase